MIVIDNTPPTLTANDTTLYLDPKRHRNPRTRRLQPHPNRHCGATLTDIFRFDNHIGANNLLGADAGAEKGEQAKSLDQTLTFECDDIGNLNLCVEIIAQDDAGNENPRHHHRHGAGHHRSGRNLRGH